MISPPGLSTRANSSSVASGSGTAVMTYCATTTSKRLVRQRQMLGVHHRQRFDIASSLCSATRSCALRSIGSEMSMPTMRLLRA